MTYFAVFAFVFLFSFSFAFYTKHAWEDWYITYRASKNLALGNGLLFTVGQRVYSFTSPLGTLIPAFLSFITGNVNDNLVLWLFRLISCLFLGASSSLLLGIAAANRMSLISVTVLIGMFAIDLKIVDFSINGMETAIMIFFLSFMLHAFIVPSSHFIYKLGLALAGLMWTRPDAFVYAGSLMIGCICFNPLLQSCKTRLELANKMLKASVLGSALYLPWVLWAYWYYGSPIPHTIIAKGLLSGVNYAELYKKVFWFPLRMIVDHSSVEATFLPPYYIFGDEPHALIFCCKLLALICACLWLFPFAKPLTRGLSFGLFCSQLYLSNVVPVLSPWYVPNVTFLTIVVLACFANDLSAHIEKLKPGNRHCAHGLARILYASMLTFIFVSLILTLIASYRFRIYQEIIENGHRKQIGLWLKGNARPTDRVFCECLGYFGYFSQLKMLDFPGMSSPEMVASRLKLQTDDYAFLIEDLMPEWLVLRPVEVAEVSISNPELLTLRYSEARIFEVSEKINNYPKLVMRRYFDFDKTFIVFKKVE